MCYVSLEFLALKLRQDSTLIVHEGTMFFLLNPLMPGGNKKVTHKNVS